MNKREIIYDKFAKLLEYNKENNINDIYKLIIEHNIPNTNNSNGVFVNLTVMNDNHVAVLYEYLNNYKITEDNDIPTYCENIINYNNEGQESKKEVPTIQKEYKDYKLNNLEECIISFSFS